MEPTTVPVKPLTKERQQESPSEWRWDSTRSVWLQWHVESKTWVVNHKSLPQWYIEANGTIPASVLLNLWKEVTSFNALHQQIFWLSKLELQQHLDHLVTECQRYGVEPPPPLSLDNAIVDVPVSEWMEQGLVVPIERTVASMSSTNSDSTYDPMQALFEAQKKRSDQGLSESRPFFQTVEQGKFTAKH